MQRVKFILFIKRTSFWNLVHAREQKGERGEGRGEGEGERGEIVVLGKMWRVCLEGTQNSHVPTAIITNTITAARGQTADGRTQTYQLGEEEQR